MGSSELNYSFSLDDVDYDTAVNKIELENEKTLLRAAIRGDYKKIEQLIKTGICVDAKKYNNLLLQSSKNYFTPLQLAALHGHDNCVQLLIDSGANVNAKDLFGFTALHLAAFKGAYNILKLLLHAKADCSVSTKISECASLKYPINIAHYKIPFINGTTPLHLAAATNNVDCVKYLICYGADFNAVDEHGRTSLYIAAQFGFSECVMIHLKEAVGQDILSLPSFKTSDTPLHFAVKFQMIDCIKALVCMGSDVNHKNFEGFSPLHTALLSLNSNMSDVLTILKLLVLEGHETDVNQADSEGFTPLHYVCFNCKLWYRRPEMAKFLIAYGANVNIKNNVNCSLLEQELMYPEDNFDILDYLVKGLLYLPTLRSLNITLHIQPDQFQPSVFRMPPGNETNNLNLSGIHVLHRRTLESITSALNVNMPSVSRNVPVDNNPDIEVFDLEEEVNEVVVPELFPRPPTVPRGIVFPLIMVDEYEVITNRNENQNVREHDHPSSLISRKQLWYHHMTSRPRTLKHHCRFLIRNILGPMKLKCIKQLPIPDILQSYLLFELEE